jgi:hypothetical protein
MNRSGILTCSASLFMLLHVAQPLVAQSGVPMSSCLSPVFGPEIVNRGTGAPVLETRTFSIAGFGPPFILHLRNGNLNGSNRVSSAEIRLNGLVLFGPDKFSQQVAGYDVPVTLSESSELSIRTAGAPGSFLQISIVGSSATHAPHERLAITPEGGRYSFLSGLVLDVPPGAVREPIAVSTCLTEQSLVEPLLQSYGLSPKYFAGGFEALPDGLTFDVPVTATFPVRPQRATGDIPLCGFRKFWAVISGNSDHFVFGI